MGYEFFTDDELRCRCGCERMEMDDYFMGSVIVPLRSLLDFPFIVASGYRCPKYNNRISTTGKNGPHTTGRAIDIRVSGHNAFLLVQEAIRVDCTGIGVHQKGKRKFRFVHLDILTFPNYPRPRIWSYS